MVGKEVGKCLRVCMYVMPAVILLLSAWYSTHARKVPWVHPRGGNERSAISKSCLYFVVAELLRFVSLSVSLSPCSPAYVAIPVRTKRTADSTQPVIQLVVMDMHH